MVGHRVCQTVRALRAAARAGRCSEAAARTTAALKAAGHDFVKLYEFERPVYDSVMAAARRTGLRVVGHVPGGVGLEAVLNDRWASIEHLTQYLNYVTGLLGHQDEILFVGAKTDTAAWLQPSYRLDPRRLRCAVELTRRNGVWNCLTLVTLWNYKRLPHTGEQYIKFDRQIMRALHDGGAGFLLGTDAMATTALPGFSIHRELELMVDEVGLTPYEALKSGTRNVAEFLGTLDSTGTIAVGKRADLVLLAANPLEDIRRTTALAGVMVNGQWLARRELDRRLDELGKAPVADMAAQSFARQFGEQMRMARTLVWR